MYSQQIIYDWTLKDKLQSYIIKVENVKRKTIAIFLINNKNLFNKMICSYNYWILKLVEHNYLLFFINVFKVPYYPKTEKSFV